MTAFQSAYRKHHSENSETESALLNIHNDILLNMAKGSVTALTLLDLFAEFDTLTTPFSWTDLMFSMESVN